MDISNIKLLKKDELLQMTMDMVRIPSYEGIPGQETGVAKYIKYVFDNEGIESWITPLEDNRSNVYAILRGTSEGSALMLNGHTDTVPPYDMINATNPWLDEKGMLHGRGVSDMKGPLAAMMGALISIKRSGVKLKGDLIFAGVADEEHQSIGTIDLLKKGVHADAVIVGEPMGPNVIAIAQMGLEWYEFKFIGKTVHGGRYKEGINAITKAVNFINIIENELKPKLESKNHPLIGRPTINIGVIKGGTQLSTVAGECSVFLDRRFLPSESYDEVNEEFKAIINRLKAEDPQFHCEMSVTHDSVMPEGYYHPGMELDAEHPFAQLVKRNLSAATGQEAKLSYCPCWTDAGLLSTFGNMPAVIFGPGDLESSHSVREYLDPSHLEIFCKSYMTTAVEFCGIEVN